MVSTKGVSFISSSFTCEGLQASLISNPNVIQISTNYISNGHESDVVPMENIHGTANIVHINMLKPLFKENNLLKLLILAGGENILKYGCIYQRECGIMNIIICEGDDIILDEISKKFLASLWESLINGYNVKYSFDQAALASAAIDSHFLKIENDGFKDGFSLTEISFPSSRSNKFYLLESKSSGIKTIPFESPLTDGKFIDKSVKRISNDISPLSPRYIGKNILLHKLLHQISIGRVGDNSARIITINGY